MMNFQNQESNELQQSQMIEVVKKMKKGIFGFFVSHFRITYLLLSIIFLLGFYAIATLPKESEPEVRVPYAVVSIAYPGANPSDVEEQIVDEIEEKIENVDNVKEYSSSAGVGYASTFVEFTAEADLETSLQDLKDAVDEAKPGLPEDANDPVVRDINFNDFPIVTYSLVGDFSDGQLREYADVLQEAFEGMRDVSKAPIQGGVEREFQILVDQEKLARFNLSLSSIVQAISLSNSNMPSGDIEIGDYQYGVRVKGKFEDLTDLEDVVVTYYENAPIFLKDIAEIQDSFADRATVSKIGLPGKTSKNTVSLQIYKKTGGNILHIVENAEKEIQSLKDSKAFPDTLDIVKTNDNSVFIKDDIHRLGKSGIQTMILIVLFLFVVLGLRGAVITGFSVPVAFLISFIVIMIQGMTINSMVLFAMVLSLGLMVDNSIIVMEGINEYMYKLNKNPFESALLSIWTYKWPIISGTMTTVAAFLPMLLVSGIMGEYMGILPKTLSATLLASLFTSLIIIPALSAKFYKRMPGHNNGDNKHRSHKIRKYVENLQEHYVKYLRSVLPYKKKRRRLTRIAVLLVIISIALPISGIMKVEMFPPVDIDYFIVDVELPTGSNLEKTNEILAKAEKIISQIPELENYVTTAGQGYSLFAGDSAGTGEHFGSIVVNLKPEGRERKSYEITESIREDVESIQGGKVQVGELTAGPPTGAPFDARIFGDDLNTLIKIAEQVKKIASDLPGLINVSDTVEESSGEFVFDIDRELATYYGLTVTEIASGIRQAIYGAEATTVSVDGDDVSVKVKYAEGEIEDANDLENILLVTSRGQQVSVRQVADLKLEPSIYEISHLDGQKVVRVTGQTDKGADIRKILAEFDKQKEEQIQLPEGYSIEIGGETEDIEQSYTEMFLSMILAVFLIIFILVLQFESFKKPFVIIFALPLAIVGAFFGLTILGLAFSLPAFIGIVSLAGIVVNDAIVLIDRINKNLDRKMDFIDGITEAGVARMQPIFLTSATTIAGIFPLALSEEMWAGLGFSIIFGLLFATVLTLIFVPVLFTSMCKKDYGYIEEEISD